MKKIYTLFFILCSLFQFSQAPQYINYQGLARNVAGVPLSNTPITLTLSIWNPGITFSETHGVTTNPLGLFSLKIGGGNQISTPSFASINWGSGTYSLQVVIDAGSGPVNLGSQQLVSVPYALYAEKAGNSVTYSTSPNLTVSPTNVIDLSDNLTTTPGTYGNIGVTQSRVPFFVVDQKGRLTTAGDYLTNVSGDIKGRLDSQYVSKLIGVPLGSVSPISGQVLQFNGTSWNPASPPAITNVWNYNSGLITPANNPANDKVAIGTTAGAGLLTVNNTNTGTITSAPIVNIQNNLPTYNSVGVLAVFNYTGGGAAMYAQNGTSITASDGLVVNMTHSLNTGNGIISTNSGQGRAGSFIITPQASSADALNASTNGTGYAVRASNNNPANGSALLATNGSSLFTAVFSNASAGGAINATGSAGGSLVLATNSGIGPAMAGNNTNTSNTAGAHGVFGQTSNTSTLSAGVLGNNTAGGPSVYGQKSGGAFGNAGRFENFNTSNSADALIGISQGSGAGVHAGAGTGATSALALLVNNGHVRSIGPAPSAVIVATLSSASMGMTYTMTNCTDVKGSAICSFTNTGVLNNSFQVTNFAFNKAYSLPPTVVITPEGNTFNLTVTLLEVTNSYFRIRIANNSGGSVSWPATNFLKINYMVLE
jgi:hypothetical protein